MYVRYKFLHISLPFSAKQQREMTKFLRILENLLGHDGKYFGFPYGTER